MILYAPIYRWLRTKFRILIEIFRERFDPGRRLPIRGWWKKKSRTLLLNLFLSRVAIFAQNITIICFSEWAIWCTKTEIEKELSVSDKHFLHFIHFWVAPDPLRRSPFSWLSDPTKVSKKKCTKRDFGVFFLRLESCYDGKGCPLSNFEFSVLILFE